MEPTQIILGAALVGVLILLAGYYARRQWQLLRALRGAGDLPPEDYRYQRSLAWRRLVGCGLMLIFAGLLIGSFTLEERGKQSADKGEAARASGQEPEFDAEERHFNAFYLAYWLALLLVLLAIVVMAAFDLLAIRRFGQRQHRKIQADLRAMVERQATRLRQGRNGRL